MSPEVIGKMVPDAEARPGKYIFTTEATNFFIQQILNGQNKIKKDHRGKQRLPRYRSVK